MQHHLLAGHGTVCVTGTKFYVRISLALNLFLPAGGLCFRKQASANLQEVQ